MRNGNLAYVLIVFDFGDVIAGVICDIKLC